MPVTVSEYVQYSLERHVRLGQPVPPTQNAIIRLAITLSLLLSNPTFQQQFEACIRRPRTLARAQVVNRESTEMDRVLGNLEQRVSEQDGRRSTMAARIRQEIPNLEQRIQTLLADPPFQPFGHDDAKAIALVEWFKLDYMRWVDPIKCPTCGGSTRSTGSAEPTSDERAGMAGRVEIHLCVADPGHNPRRFARYNDLMTLVSTREGRCGEFAHVFCFFLGVYGLNARYVWNSEDHVWTEYWSDALKHWVHIDSCEAAVNKPLLYASGWGKKQAFCIAAGPEGLQDVTESYVNDWSGACQDRRRARAWSETELRHSLEERTTRLLSRLRPDESEVAAERERLHTAWLGNDAHRAAEALERELGGRESGPQDWREARQEVGTSSRQRRPFTVKRPVFDSLVDEPKLFGHIADLGVAPGFPSELTSGPSQTSAMFTEVAISQSTSFSASMTFRLDASGGGADGLALVFTSDRGLGLGGYGMGYSGIGDAGDFAVEVDTYRTEDHANDPPTPHISIHSPLNAHHRYSLTCAKPSQLLTLTDGAAHELFVIFEAVRRRLQVSIDGRPVLEASVPRGEGKDWYMGVTAACGGLYQITEILKWSWSEITLQAVDEPDVCIGHEV